MFYLIQIHFVSAYFEFLTFEFKKKIKYKKIEGIHKIFSKGHCVHSDRYCVHSNVQKIG